MSQTRFLHTADWQSGKAFAGVQDREKRATLQRERIACLARIADAARAHEAEFILVSGDLFDSPRPTDSVVSALCSAVGRMRLPVYAVPGNHDHGGPGSVWDQPFFRSEAASLAPNLHLLLRAEPVELPNAVLFPCPLLRRHEPEDVTAWLRSLGELGERFGDKPRIVLAHGSTQGFGSATDDDEGVSVGDNQINLGRLPPDAFDYIALGDWHGTKQVGAHAWYSGTPELDRFPKGHDHDPGNVLLVTSRRASLPEVRLHRTARIGWFVQPFTFADDAGVEQLQLQLEQSLGQRTSEDLLQLELTGNLGLEATTRLERLLTTFEARLLRLKLDNRSVVVPSDDELNALTQRAADPLISRVATKLAALATADTEAAAIARVALRELHARIHA